MTTAPASTRKYEAGGDGEYVEKGDVLESGGVGRLHQDVDDDDDAKLRRSRAKAEASPASARTDRRDRREVGGYDTGGDGPVSLGRVGLVSLPVGEVVDEIDGAADEAEDDGGSDGARAELECGLRVV